MNTKKAVGGSGTVLLPIKLGPRGPFPDIALSGMLERRWLHYAFVSIDSEFAIIANVAWLGTDSPSRFQRGRNTSILLVHKRGEGWRSSEFSAETRMPIWSSFRFPPYTGEPGRLKIVAVAKAPFVKLQLHSTSHPSPNVISSLGHGQFLRVQAETGVIARGDLGFDDKVFPDVQAIGYHDRTRGWFSWPAVGGWLFGFTNNPQTHGLSGPPCSAVMFKLTQPPTPLGRDKAVVLLWQNGRMCRIFPGRNIRVMVRGELDRNRVSQCPPSANLIAVPPMQSIPRQLLVTARLGNDWLVINFQSESAARIIVFSEVGIHPFSVHQTIGSWHVEGQVKGKSFAFESTSVVEFAGGADAHH